MYAGSPSYLWDSTLQAARQYIVISKRTSAAKFVLKRDEILFHGRGKGKNRLQYAGFRYKDIFAFNERLYEYRQNREILELTPDGPKKCTITGDILINKRFKSGTRNFIVHTNHLSDQSFLLLGNSLYELKIEGKNKLRTRLLSDSFDIVGNQIITILYTPATGRIFLGSISRGLFVLTPKQFLSVPIMPGQRENVIYGQARTSNGLVMVAGGKILHFPNVLSHASSAKKEWDRKRNNNLDEITIAVDTLHQIWTTNGYFLHRNDSAGNVILSSWKLEDWITTMQLGSKGILWIGTKNAGIWYKNVYKNDSFPKKLYGSNLGKITNIYPNGDHLYVGTDRGLYTISLKTKKAILLPGSERLNVRGILKSVHEGRDMLFFSTYGSGIYLYSNRLLTKLPVDANKSLLFAHCFIEDHFGYLWMTTNSGLVQARKDDLIDYSLRSSPFVKPFYIHYGKRHGFVSNEFNGGCVPCAVRLPNQIVSLPSMEGLVWYHPESIRREVPDKDIFVDLIKASSDTLTLTGSIVKLPLAPKQISVHVTTPFFGDPINLSMSYALTGKDERPSDSAWIEINEQNPIIAFSEMKSGHHLLHIKKASGFGLSNYTYKTISFFVPPRWYETSWFYLGGTILSIVLAHLYSKVRSQYLRRENLNLERKIRLRTSSLQETMGALRRSEERANQQVFIQTRLIASISHDIRNPLRYLGMLLGSINRSAETGNLDRITEICSDLMRSTERMATVLDNHLEYGRTLLHNSFQSELIKIAPIVEQKKELFLPYLKQRGNRIADQVSDEITVLTDPDLFMVIVHNLIDNANKYTSDGIIRIAVRQSDDFTEFCVSDSGPGLSKETLDWINDHQESDYDAQMVQYKHKNTGLGLLIIKDLSRMLDITLKASNQSGAQISLIFKHAGT